MVLLTTRVAIGFAAALFTPFACAQDVITSDTHFYGQSPPVYPSPNATGLGNWADAYSKAKTFVSQLSLEEKVNLTAGGPETNGCSGSIPAIPRLNFPGMCLSDAGNGLRSTDFVSSWPSGMSVGASWNIDLAKSRAVGMASEFRVKGVNVALGPVVGPLGRIAVGGRNWEGFSNDPYLCGSLAAETVTGIQSTGVITSTKHFIANEQETNRNPSGNVSAVSSNIDDKTMHELCLWPFQDAVHAGSGNIMCSYNRINNSYGCDNSKTLNGLLKTELGFQGFVVSDWGAQHAGVASAQAGLDMAMPGPGSFWGSNLTMAVNNGSVPESRIDDMATRIIATWYQFGQDKTFTSPGIGVPKNLAQPHDTVVGTNSSYKKTLFDGAVEGHVLVKNQNGALPLKSPKLISLFGYSAKAPDNFDVNNGGWNNGGSSLGPQDTVTANRTTTHSQIASNGTLISGGGSGANQPAYISSPFEALSQRAYDDGSALLWDFHSSAPNVDPTSDACVVVGNAWATEGADRPGLRDDFTDGLVLGVAARCAKTVVVLHNAGVRLVDRFVDHPNVSALIFAHTPGQDAGRALVALLYGDANPSGKMPYSVPRNETDYGGLQNATLPEGVYEYYPQSEFGEGVYIDYRGFDKRNVTPRYEFGFGLSYTTFTFGNVAAVLAGGGCGKAPYMYPTEEVVPGGRADLWNVVATVTAEVTNAGDVAGAEVAQLYVGVPGGPVRQLRGFEKVFLQPGEKREVSFGLTRRDLSTWDVVAQEWLLQRGTYRVYVGASSRDLPLTTSLKI
ncbi:glycoside hydrolase family 3 protein [Coniochaeta ligniaria NRRL 30616]|uniref:beta-glucosidase n=1 Tax=Coniochaeta ligniaria NRRL 30616 TaxID=1408157 RepID=A0A1J7JRQ8_9PEZI|nr:glycoside hydrolase family 3 protein [Coniochaeta ligniaria NRRL 30616]